MGAGGGAGYEAYRTPYEPIMRRGAEARILEESGFAAEARSEKVSARLPRGWCVHGALIEG
jgi:hypothetical protein